MTLYDLLFVAIFFTAAGLCLAGVLALLRRRTERAQRFLLRAGVTVAVYLTVVAAVGLLSPRRRVAVGEDQCFGAWQWSACTAWRNWAR